MTVGSAGPNARRLLVDESSRRGRELRVSPSLRAGEWLSEVGWYTQAQSQPISRVEQDVPRYALQTTLSTALRLLSALQSPSIRLSRPARRAPLLKVVVCPAAVVGGRVVPVGTASTAASPATVTRLCLAIVGVAFAASPANKLLFVAA
ncbi:hypothetical protein RTBOTA2_000164 [Rhodotorula toruloides]|nr:hypothetical protein RTBOTA2_000164 [Rhodotorula toruloides]